MYFKNKSIKGRKYRYAVRSLRMPNGKSISVERLVKNESKKEIEKILEEKELNAYKQFMLGNYATDSVFSSSEFEKIEKVRLSYKKILKKLTKVTLKDLFDRFTANFTYESNALEGNSLTLKEVALVLFEKTSVKGKDLREIFETRNSRKVVDLIIKNKFSVNNDDIIKMHKMLVKDMDISPGYKKFPNEVFGRSLKTTPPENVQKEMNELIEWYEKNNGKFHPLKLVAHFHGKFEKIHPFEDGNGRVGRFLINIILIKNKYPPLIIRKSQRLGYLSALEAFDNDSPIKLERFILERFKETYLKFFEVYVKYI